ncbi:hypothetical protein SARC_14956 [Sphaeroforma arctica JP610]|uniref:Myb-like domain-containing protein n=1 Tax=Sphaeroforma arctica JP610 TaxID=667725 RepID=A0A0L0F7C7_9EUKA|nr:hypothetical protein SARC_14956 [Sphaeroforma arctica JP610]KNC72486.1 hypothetical protein SARC_14956 [Sphaeroforma arctica JP610]|eukprot:XP_014146388.1 hypothetical protein SARC_14956 [Sphaeroforma arctica JP610]
MHSFVQLSVQRWQTIADYINARDGNVTGDDVMNKTKAEKVGGKKNVDAFEAFEKKGHKPIEELHSMGGISQRYDDDDEKTDEWTTEQQKALEAGISTYKELSKEEGKWDRIADMVEGKDAKHCVARIKAIKKAMKAKM